MYFLYEEHYSIIGIRKLRYNMGSPVSSLESVGTRTSRTHKYCKLIEAESFVYIRSSLLVLRLTQGKNDSELSV